MFEKYEIDDLFYCTIEDMMPIGMTNCGGAISIEGAYGGAYETILLYRNGKYYDINHLDRVINLVRCPQREMPITSNNRHLYVIIEETLIPYRERNYTDKNVLQRLPFGKTRHI